MKQPSHVGLVHNAGIQIAISAGNISSPVVSAEHLLLGPMFLKKQYYLLSIFRGRGCLEYDIGSNNRTVTEKLLFVTRGCAFLCTEEPQQL